jgi:hypothetical protein
VVKEIDWLIDDINVESENFLVIISHIGEGYEGDYNEEDPADKPLLRYDIYHKSNEDEVIPDGSSCTNISTDSLSSDVKYFFKEVVLVEAEKLLKEIEDTSYSLSSIGKKLFKYSHLSDEEILVHNHARKNKESFINSLK